MSVSLRLRAIINSGWPRVPASLLVIIALASLLALPPVYPTALAATPAITRGPYLQLVSQTSVTVVWETDIATNGIVEYGPDTTYGQVASDPSVGLRHVVAITGLSPFTTYRYRVGTSSGALAGSWSFKTLPQTGQEPWTFTVFGDTRTNTADHQRVVDSIVTAAPGLALHTGDLVEDGSVASLWDTFFSVERNLMSNTPVLPTIGNHEGDAVIYLDRFYLPGNEQWYSFDCGNVHFVTLNTSASFSTGSAQYLWLQDNLARNRLPWTVVWLHIPPYSSGPHGRDQAVQTVQTTLSPLFEYYGVDLVLSGHDHDYERSIVNGITYIVAGGGGAPLYDKQFVNPWTIYFEKTLHYVIFTIAGNSIQGHGVRPDGSTFDSFTIQKRALAAETSISQGAAADGLATVNVLVNRIKDASTGVTANIPGGLGGFRATASSSPTSGIQLLGAQGVSPYDNPAFNAVTGEFGVASVASPHQPNNDAVARLVTRLNGDANTAYTLSITFNQLTAASGSSGVPEEHSNSLTFRRGDAKPDSVVNIFDAMYIAQYIVGNRPAAEINYVNAASVKQDGVSGDRLDIFDAMYIAQYVVGTRNSRFE